MPPQNNKDVIRERRKHARKKCYAPVSYAVNDVTCSGFIINISFGDAFIESSVPIEAGQAVTFSVKISEDREPVSMIGQVVRVGPDGFGVKFIMGIDESVLDSIV